MSHPITFKLLGLLAEYGDICREWKLGDKKLDAAALAKRQEVVGEMNRLLAADRAATTPATPDFEDWWEQWPFADAKDPRTKGVAHNAWRAALTAPDRAANSLAAPELTGDTFLSWGGFNLCGDRASIAEAKRLVERCASLEQYLKCPSVPPVGVGREAEHGSAAVGAGAAELPAPELNALLDHIYEYGTGAEGVELRARKLCEAYARAVLGAVAVDAAPQQNPDSVHQVGATPQAAAAPGRFTDTQRLDYLNRHPEAVLGLGTRWYYKSPRGHRKFYALRDALDAAIKGAP